MPPKKQPLNLDKIVLERGSSSMDPDDIWLLCLETAYDSLKVQFDEADEETQQEHKAKFNRVHDDFGDQFWMNKLCAEMAWNCLNTN